jgi:adenosylmethionine-8-amino-7-oxononanoate aminotransferase
MGEDLAGRVAYRARELGVIVRLMFGGSLQISPPLVINHGEIQRIAETLGQALTECAADPAAGRRP